MAELLGAVASGIAVAQAAGALISLCRQIRSAAQTVRNAPEEVTAAVGRVEALETVLAKLKDAADAASASRDSADRLSDLCAHGGPIENCRRCLEQLVSLLPSTSAAAASKRGFAKAVARLGFGIKWKLKASQAKALLDEVQTYQDLIQARLRIATQ